MIKQGFLDMELKTSHKTKLDTKIKNVCLKGDSLKKMKTTHRMGGNICNSSDMYLEYIKNSYNNNKKTISQCVSGHRVQN